MNGQPALNTETKTIQLQFMPSDDFISAVLSLSNNEDFKTIVNELHNRTPGLAVASCHINNEIISNWVQGRVQELQDLSTVFHEARIIMIKRREGKAKGNAAASAL